MEKRNLTLIVLMLVVSILAVFLAQAQEAETKQAVEKGIKAEKSKAPSDTGGCCAWAADKEAKAGCSCGKKGEHSHMANKGIQKGHQEVKGKQACKKGGCTGCPKCAKNAGNQKTCPIMGGKINKNLSAEHKGKRVFFCCQGCIERFKKDPDKYIKKLEGEGVTLEKVTKPQETCPIMGGRITSKYYADHEGKRVYFCCPGCPAKFKENPEKYLEILEEKGEVPELITKEM